MTPLATVPSPRSMASEPPSQSGRLRTACRSQSPLRSEHNNFRSSQTIRGDLNFFFYPKDWRARVSIDARAELRRRRAYATLEDCACGKPPSSPNSASKTWCCSTSRPWSASAGWPLPATPGPVPSRSGCSPPRCFLFPRRSRSRPFPPDTRKKAGSTSGPSAASATGTASCAAGATGSATYSTCRTCCWPGSASRPTPSGPSTRSWPTIARSSCRFRSCCSGWRW